MTIIATRNLRREDVPQGNFSWSTFSQFALTFDPLFEATDEFDQMPASAMPSEDGVRWHCGIIFTVGSESETTREG